MTAAKEILLKLMLRKSQCNVYPSSVSPKPANNLIVSIAPMHAMVPDVAPNTGNCRFQYFGISGVMQRRHGLPPAENVVAVASVSYIAQLTWGLLYRTQASFIANRS